MALTLQSSFNGHHVGNGLMAIDVSGSIVCTNAWVPFRPSRPKLFSKTTEFIDLNGNLQSPFPLLIYRPSGEFEQFIIFTQS